MNPILKVLFLLILVGNSQESLEIELEPTPHIDLETITGYTYQLQDSSDLVDWDNYGDPIVGDGQIHETPFTLSQTLPRRFFHYLRLGDYIDLDRDGLSDEWERAFLDSNFYFSSLIEIFPYDDLDGDGITNIEEFRNGDPLQLLPFVEDCDGDCPDQDGDGMSDAFESLIIQHSGDINTFADVALYDDYDGDSLSNMTEFEQGTNPISADITGWRPLIPNVGEGQIILHQTRLPNVGNLSLPWVPFFEGAEELHAGSSYRTIHPSSFNPSNFIANTNGINGDGGLSFRAYFYNLNPSGSVGESLQEVEQTGFLERGINNANGQGRLLMVGFTDITPTLFSPWSLISYGFGVIEVTGQLGGLNNSVGIYENGVLVRDDVFNARWDDTLAIERRGDTIFYLINGEVVYESLIKSVNPLYFYSSVGSSSLFLNRTVIALGHIQVRDMEQLALDTDSDGILDSFEVEHGLTVGVDDAFLDADDDGLSNIAEFHRRTLPANTDTDGDSIKDGLEVEIGLNPSVANTGDVDGDNIPDLYEVEHGLNPISALDGILDRDDDGLINIAEFLNGTNLDNPDSDNDGLTDGEEVLIHLTSPLSFDTDGDLLDDAFEIEFGLNALTTNTPDQDTDNDGVSDFDERVFGSNPTVADTDADGTGDLDEINSGFDPAGGENPDNEERKIVDVEFAVGDPSGSNSERWELIIKGTDSEIDEREILFTSSVFGEVDTRPFALVEGASYELTIRHVATDSGEETDFDWQATVDGQSGEFFSFTVDGASWLVDNSDRLLGNVSGNETNESIGRTTTIFGIELITVSDEVPQLPVVLAAQEAPSYFLTERIFSPFLSSTEISEEELDLAGTSFRTNGAIRASKMENSLNASGHLRNVLDDDRFKIRIKKAGSEVNGSVTISTIESGQYNDDETVIPLINNVGNTQFTDSQLLVTSTETDKVNVNTHSIALGGKLVVKNPIVNGNMYEFEREYDFSTVKEFNASIIFCGDAPQDMADYTIYQRLATEIFTQANIKANFTNTTMDFPSGIDPNNVNHEPSLRNNGLLPHNDIIALHDKAVSEEKNSDITIYVVPNLRDFSGAAGRAHTERTIIAGSGYANIALISDIDVKGNDKIFTFAHEIGHIVTNNFHYGEDYATDAEAHQIEHNLMRSATSQENTISSSKRLYKSQRENSTSSILKNVEEEENEE